MCLTLQIVVIAGWIVNALEWSSSFCDSINIKILYDKILSPNNNTSSIYNIKLYSREKRPSIIVQKGNRSRITHSSAMLYSLRISLGLVFPLSNVASLFFIFIRLFWNQILMCFSERLKDLASSILRALVMYLLNKNSFSSSTCCLVV